jgi:hypothetical protein
MMKGKGAVVVCTLCVIGFQTLNLIDLFWWLRK